MALKQTPAFNKFSLSTWLAFKRSGVMAWCMGSSRTVALVLIYFGFAQESRSRSVSPRGSVKSTSNSPGRSKDGSHHSRSRSKSHSRSRSKSRSRWGSFLFFLLLLHVSFSELKNLVFVLTDNAGLSISPSHGSSQDCWLVYYVDFSNECIKS